MSELLTAVSGMDSVICGSTTGANVINMALVRRGRSTGFGKVAHWWRTGAGSHGLPGPSHVAPHPIGLG